MQTVNNSRATHLQHLWPNIRCEYTFIMKNKQILGEKNMHGYSRKLILSYNSLETQTVKNLFVMQETQAQSLGQEDPLEKRMATHSSVLA